MIMEREVYVTYAEVSKDPRGQLGILVCFTEDLENKSKEAGFIPVSMFRIPSNKNPKEELQDLVDLFNGFKKVGEDIIPIPDWSPRKILVKS